MLKALRRAYSISRTSWECEFGTKHPPQSYSACGSDQPLAVFSADSQQQTLTSSTFHGMKSTAFLTAALIVTHLQAAPPAHYLGHTTKQPRHRHNVHPKSPLARHGAGLPVMPNPPGQRVQPVPNPTGIHVRPITNLRGTTFPNYAYALSNPSFTPFEIISPSMNINVFTIS